MKDSLKLAILQLRTELDRTETMEKTARMLREAASKGAGMSSGFWRRSCSMVRRLSPAG